MGKIDGNSFYVTHTCECSPGYVFERSFVVDNIALTRFLGSIRPVLPYRAGPGRALPLKDSQERSLRVFAWECHMLESVEEFLLLCSRPPLR